MELFKTNGPQKGPPGPLSERMRPVNIDEFTGQAHLLSNGKIARAIIEKKEIPSLILWGPPGSGKTTLAYILARASGAHVRSFSAVLSGIKDIREITKEAKEQWKFFSKKTVLFVDEIHRFNKAQQDAFLPHVENGTIALIGATTENPSFEVNAPLLSRCKVLVLKPLSEEEIKVILKRALADKEKGLGNMKLKLNPKLLDVITSYCQGDARSALNTLEAAVMLASPDKNGLKSVTFDHIEEALQQKALIYDKGGEEHYNVISAFIKSMRGSDPDAALYYLARMLEAGEDPLFIIRRMVIFASEDIGNADPQALSLAVATKDAFHFTGLPEGWIPLAQCAAYLASAPKSNASYVAYKEALKDVKNRGSLPVPLHIRNAPTRLMKELDYGKGYRYPHNYDGGHVNEDYLPQELRGKIYYKPKNIGKEKEIKERLERLREKKAVRGKITQS